MKYILTILFSFALITTYGQFTISGTIENYENQPILVKTIKNAQPTLYTRVVTNQQGNFTLKIDYDYSGLIQLETTKGILELLANNIDINLTLDIESPKNSMRFTDDLNKTYIDYLSMQDKMRVATEMLPVVQQFYSEEDAFYNDIQQEIQRIQSLPIVNTSKFPALEYFINAREAIASYDLQKMAADEILEDSKNHILNDEPYISEYGLLNEFLTSYISSSIGNAINIKAAENNIEVEVDTLLIELQPETSRGQEVLTLLIPFLKGNKFTDLSDKYKQQAQSLTCEILPGLKKIIDPAKELTKGDKVPNIKFPTKIKGAKSLYDVKAKEKLIVFWGSWCPHCTQELPFIKEFYKDFKANGGEIIAFAIELDDSYKTMVLDTDWINTTDYLKWDSPLIEEFGVMATPTFFLVDKNNIIIKKGSNISQFMK